MKRKKIKIITNLILCLTVMAVFTVGFLPEKAVLISGSETYSPIYSGDKNSSFVALTFNVYENTEVVKEIVDVLSTNGVKATFFVGGCWADDNKETLNLILSKGNELGNHGYFHKNHKKLNKEQNLSEIANNDKIVTALTGYKMNLFAPPSGAFSTTTLKVAESLNYKTVLWSKDTIDWRDTDKNLIKKRALNGVKGGDIILMHPKVQTLEVLEEIIKGIKNKGLQPTTVSECCGFNAV